LLSVFWDAASPQKMILQKSKSEKTDVFTEGAGEGAVPAGFAELIIKAGVKTHREGYYRFESKESPLGKPGKSQWGHPGLCCGLAMSHKRAGVNPTLVTASHRPSIQPCRLSSNGSLDA